jgi:hypothetical protein
MKAVLDAAQTAAIVIETGAVIYLVVAIRAWRAAISASQQPAHDARRKDRD